MQRIIKAAGAICTAVTLSCCSGGGSSSPATTLTTAAPSSNQQHILFVGDSLTHGRYLPVRQYDNGGTITPASGSALVVDENYGQTGARAESSSETGPWGGIPGIFSQLALEAGLNYDVHIEAISSTNLTNNYAAASSVIAQSKWNSVVLQELTTRPLTHTLTNDSSSNPAAFCSAVQTI